MLAGVRGEYDGGVAASGGRRGRTLWFHPSLPKAKGDNVCAHTYRTPTLAVRFNSLTCAIVPA